jgi:stage II sporulation protein D
LPLEEYVAAVLAGEATGFRSAESLKAMAVAARTYAAHFLGRHEREGFDFCDTTHCQDFRITAVNSRHHEAVNATANEVLRYDRRPIPAYYHQNCGGAPEPHAPYLRQTKDSFCLSKTMSDWSQELSAAEIERALGLAGVYRIDVIARTSSGRAQRLQIAGAENRVIEAEAFRLAIGRNVSWAKIPSDMYDVRGEAGRFVFAGHGAGHGLGLCQEGAAAMGAAGHSYRDILAYYYPNTDLTRERPGR